MRWQTLSAFAIPVLFSGLQASGQETAVVTQAALDQSALRASPPETKPPVEKEKHHAKLVLSRLEIQWAAVETRYRVIENSQGVTTTNQLQGKEGLKARVKLDPKGKYSVHGGLFTGNNFTGSWNNTGAGTGSLVTNVYLKQLYLSAKPVKELEFQYGGLYVNRGESTEVTGYDNDAYLLGERVTVRAPKKLHVDELSAVYGYLGDVYMTNINKRFYRLKSANYHQFLAAKKFTKWLAASADYTFLSGAETLRQGVKVGTKQSRVVDSVLVEAYQRLDVKAASGVHVCAEKGLHKRVNVGGGFASIDPNYGGLNADRFNKGKRVYGMASVSVTPALTASTFVTRAVSNTFAVANRTRFDLVLSYNVLKGLQRPPLNPSREK